MRRLLLSVGVIVLAGCPVTSDLLCAKDTCIATAGDGGASVPTDPCFANPTAPECLDEAKALFVDAATANGAGSLGTKASPHRSLATALASVTADKKRIYVCEGRYAENVTISGPSHDGVSVFGGVDCTWNAKDVKPVIGASSSPFVVNAAKSVAIANVAIEAADSQDGSSIALLALAAGIEIKNTRLVAGNAGNGASGVLQPLALPDRDLLDGNPGQTNQPVGGAAKTFTCPGVGSPETRGGRGASTGGATAPAEAGLPSYDATSGRAGAGATCGAGAGTGGDGAPGPAGANGTGASRWGDFDGSAWKPANGGNGEQGKCGQGGGGGIAVGGFGGGGGGAGGCGGGGAIGGAGGGSSIAIASSLSKIKLTSSTLEAKNAGRGGDGVFGQGGSLGGFAGLPSNAISCPAGGGGAGGTGGASGGGAGGVSAAVLYQGADHKPELDPATSATLKRGSAGGRGVGPATNDGIEGKSENVLELP